jgi:hypothetical protein
MKTFVDPEIIMLSSVYKSPILPAGNPFMNTDDDPVVNNEGSGTQPIVGCGVGASPRRTAPNPFIKTDVEPKNVLGKGTIGLRHPRPNPVLEKTLSPTNPLAAAGIKFLLRLLV